MDTATPFFRAVLHPFVPNVAAAYDLLGVSSELAPIQLPEPLEREGR